MKNNYFPQLFAALMVVFCLVGCGEKKVPLERTPWVPRMANPAPQAFKAGPSKTLEEMKDDDVMVAVNGIPLYKWQFGRELNRFWWTIKQNQRAKPQELEAEYRRFGRTYLSNYINSQLFVQAGRAQGLLTASQIVERVEQGVTFAAHRFGMPPKVLDRNLPGGLNDLRYTLEDHLWQEAYIASNVVVDPVTPSLISNIYAQINAENAGIKATNVLQRAKIDRIYARAKAGEDFGKLVDEFGEDSDVEKGKGGYWDSYQTAMDVPPVIKDNVFPLPVGGLTSVLEDDEGYYFIKLIKKTDIPQPTNAAKVVEYDMGRMWVAKEQYTVFPDGYNLKKSIEEQFRHKAIEGVLTNLIAKAQVVYPNGTNFFGKAKKSHRKLSSTERQARKIKKAMEKGQDPKKLFKVRKQGAKKAVKEAAKEPSDKAKRTDKNAKKRQQKAKAKQEVGK